MDNQDSNEFLSSISDEQKILVICDHKLPTPDRDAGSVRMDLIVKTLITLNFKIFFISLSQDRYPTTSYKGLKAIYGTDGLEIKLENLKLRPFLLWVARPNVAVVTYPTLRRLYPFSPLVYDTVDLHALRLSRELELIRPSLPKIEFDYRRDSVLYTKRIERFAIRESDIAVYVTDADMSAAPCPPKTGVELVVSQVNPVVGGTSRIFATRKHLLFLGGFAHTPNVDAVIWFSNEVLPDLRKKIHDVQLMIVGADVPSQVEALSKLAGVQVLGYRKSITRLINSALLMVAPLRYGAGIKGKVTLSMAAGLPVVGTTIAFEGIPIQNGFNAIVANTRSEFVEAICGMHSNERMWDLISKNSRVLAEERFSQSAVVKALTRLLKVASEQKANNLCFEPRPNRLTSIVDRMVISRGITKLKSLINNKKDRIVIWGNGRGGKSLTEFLLAHERHIERIIDGSKHLDHGWFRKIRVETPCWLLKEVQKSGGSKLVVVIASVFADNILKTWPKIFNDTKVRAIILSESDLIKITGTNKNNLLFKNVTSKGSSK